MSHTKEKHAPVILDPGDGIWPDEPKVTSAERLLYGDMAPVVRLLGQCSVLAQDAYALACRTHNEWNGQPVDELEGTVRQEAEERLSGSRQAINLAHAAYLTAQDSYMTIASETALFEREFQRRFRENE